VIKSRSQRWAGHATPVEEKESAYSVLVEISGGKKPPGKPQHRWKDNIKIYLQIGWGRGGLYFSGTEERQEVGCGTFTREVA
jgi:hypothetical protein